MSAGNSFNFVGRLVAVPELRDAGSTKVCHFTLASNVYKNGEQVSIFPEFEAWGANAERICDLQKGKRIGVCARYDESTWPDKDEHKRKTIRFVVESFMYVDTRNEESSSDVASEPDSAPVRRSAPQNDVITDDSDDDLPF